MVICMWGCSDSYLAGRTPKKTEEELENTEYTMDDVSKSESYSHNELLALPAEELYELFIHNGLVVDEELRRYMSDKQIADMLKKEFDMLITGFPQRSHSMYLRFAKEVQIVYEQMMEVNE